MGRLSTTECTYLPTYLILCKAPAHTMPFLSKFVPGLKICKHWPRVVLVRAGVTIRVSEMASCNPSPCLLPG